jgi:hypothetical protein
VPWGDLDGIIDTSPANFLQDCTEEYNVPFDNRTNWQLIVSDLVNVAKGFQPQTSPLCLPNFFCAFKDCNPDPRPYESDRFHQLYTNGNSSTIPINPRYTSLDQFSSGVTYDSVDGALSLPPDVKEWIDDVDNPSYNLPSKAVFPESARDVVNAVNFARVNGVKISIKNTGHSYTGSSTR